MKKIRFLAFVLVVVMLASVFAACGDDENTGDNGNKPTSIYQAIDDKDAVEHESFDCVYDTIGADITINDVEENEEGLAFVTVEGVKYELGMDFLSMAMVYNTTNFTKTEKFQTEEDVYNEWWKLYIQRWNYLVPEVPLYSNQYYDLYNAKIENFQTTPYWSAADAIVAANVKAGEENSVILGSSTALSGKFRYPSWGQSSGGSSDMDVQGLTSGFSTVMTNKYGNYNWNMDVLQEIPTSVLNDDDTLTYTIKVKSGNKFSDGSAINAKNYIVGVLALSTPVAVAAGGTGIAGSTLVGFKAFQAYDGTNDGQTVGEGAKAVTASKYFSGVQLIDDNTFKITLTADYAGYYYSIANAAFSPDFLELYLGKEGAIEVDPDTKACGLNAAFYAKEEDKYTVADEIVANLKWNSAIPYSGPYKVSNYDDSAKIATLVLNDQYPGDAFRGTASIATITYIKVEEETQMDKFKKGEVDVIAGITGGDETKAALKIVQDEPDKYAETHYDRAGYGKLGFRADFGPSGMIEVRQAIMYTINRPEFAATFTGGYGSVVHGPYYAGEGSTFKKVEDEINLNQYTYSTASAIAVLEAGGWIYNEKGETFNKDTDTIRYKKLSGYELSKDNLHFQSVDGKYKTVKIDGNYYMPLAINWFGTQPNSVTDLLLTAWANTNAATKDIGMYIQYISTDFTTGVYAELCHSEEDGYNGTPRLNAINFATGFTSAAYDYSFNWRIDPEWADYSACYVLDAADFMENYQN